MKTIQVYDPPMCCSTGICGTDINPDLVNFAAQLGTQGLKVERYNLGQQPMAFAENAAVKALLDKEGAEALPIIFLDGEVPASVAIVLLEGSTIAVVLNALRLLAWRERIG